MLTEKFPWIISRDVFFCIDVSCDVTAWHFPFQCKILKPKTKISSSSQALNFASLWRQKFAKPNVIREKLLNWLSCKKCAHKMLMKLTARGRFRHYFFHRWKIVSTQRWCSISPQHSSHTWTEFATTLCLISELNFVCRLTNMMCAVCQLMLFAVVNFINFFTYKFFVRMSFWQLFLCTCN